MSEFVVSGRPPKNNSVSSIDSTVTATIPNLELAQGSTTAGQVGPLVQGAVTTSQPTYTTGTTAPFSISTSGALRVNVTSITAGTGATSLGKAEDAAHTTGDTGVFSLAVRNDADAVVTSTDGDYSQISVDSAGRVKGVSPNLELAQASTTAGQLGPLMQAAVSSATPSYTNAQTSPLSLTTNGALRSAVTSVTAGTGATSLGKAEDAAHTTGDTGVYMLAVRNDGGASAVATTNADADYSSINVDKYSNLTVKGAIVPTYMASTATFTPAATATDIFHIGGSSTKTLKILRIILSGTQTTLGGSSLHSLIKRSSANSGGTPVAATLVSADSGFPAATALVEHYTANPTLGGTVAGFGTFYNPRTTIPAAASPLAIPVIFDFDIKSMMNGHPIVLRGTSEEVAINLGGTTPSGAANYSITIFWTEE